MASRKEQKEQARAEREARATAQLERESRRRRLWQLGAAAVTAAAVVIIAIAISTAGGGKHKAAPPSLFAGIPQHGIVLGNPNAPVTMTEFADLQCPFCARYATDVLPTLVRDYVRTGRLKMEFRDMAFLGDDSVTAGRAAAAAAQQNRMWQFIDLFYGNQGEENSGYVTDGFIRKIARQVPGLDVERLMGELQSPTAQQQIEQGRSAARTLGVKSTPSFFLQRGAGTQKKLDFSDYSAGSFKSAIDDFLSG